MKSFIVLMNLNIQDTLSILDLGCGEGYYTQGLKKHFESSDVYGLRYFQDCY